MTNFANVIKKNEHKTYMEKIFVIALFYNGNCTIGNKCYNNHSLATNVVKQQANEMQNSDWFRANNFYVVTEFEGYFYAENENKESIRICIFQTQLENNLQNN